MIDEVRTANEFGYTSANLTYGSGKKVYGICNYCGYTRLMQYKAHVVNNGTCGKCANKGERNHFFGKYHSKETKEKISKARIGIYCGENHPMYGADRSGVNNPFHGKHHSFESRKQSSATKRNVTLLEWDGFSSYTKYGVEFKSEYKETIRELHGRKCAICGISEADNGIAVGNGERLCVHHIDMDKMNSDISNLVPLCKGCHGSAHTNEIKELLTAMLKNIGVSE